MKSTKFIGHFYYLDLNGKRHEFTKEINICGGALQAFIILYAEMFSNSLAGELYKIEGERNSWDVKEFACLSHMLNC